MHAINVRLTVITKRIFNSRRTLKMTVFAFYE